MKRRSLIKAFAPLLVCLLIALPLGAAQAGTFEDEATIFVKNLAKKAIGELTNKSAPREKRIALFRNFFTTHFAVKGIGKWILGRHWKKATPDERAEYLRLFEDLMVISYVDRFAAYTGEPLLVIKTLRQNDTNATVYAEIEQPGGAPTVHVDWRVARKGTMYKIVDVIVEGTSMSSTLRSDFGSTIRRRGGKVSGLIDALRKKTKGLRSSSE
ncbi:MAG TPA: ABC transporter substrate-binding protein [Rhodospirillales bacterium]|nr:ABC transporter substrate-binding protein [Rhodospirillales bacterium]